MEIEPLSKEKVGLSQFGWKSETPLWFYILKKAEVHHHGERLADVGGRIVAEVLPGLIGGDPDSYLNAEPEWNPELPSSQEGYFTMADLLRFAKVV